MRNKIIGVTVGTPMNPDKKLDKATPNDTYTVLYALKSNGENVTQRLTPSDVNNTVMFRDANGYCKIKKPTKDEHIANKGYVDAEIETLKAEIEALKALVDKLDKQLNPLPTIKGTWTFNDYLSGEIANENVRFTYSDWSDYTHHVTGLFVEFQSNYDLGYEGCAVYFGGGEVRSAEIGWLDNDYRTITFDGEQEVSAEFVAFMEANATKVKEEIAFTAINDVEGEYFTVTCEKGMTWEDYANSEYNKEPCVVTIDGDAVYARIGMRGNSQLWRYNGGNSDYVSKNDVIEPNTEYAIE